MDHEHNLAGLDVIPFAKARCRNSLFNTSSKSALVQICADFYCSQSGFIWVRFLKQGEGFDISPGKSGVDE